jgi:hypothetical protein
MPVNLRLSLTVFKIGFLVESASGFAALLTGANHLPFHGYLILLSPVISGVGILFLYVGRHEWNELHLTRVRFAGTAFALNLVAIVLAAVPIAYLTITGAASSSRVWEIVFGTSIALIFGITFVTYALVAAHLVGRVGEIAMGVGLAWSLIISALIGIALSPQLRPLAQSIAARSPALGSVTSPITLFDGLLGFSYLAFFVAFADAHYRVAKGLDPAGAPVAAKGRAGA